MREAGRTRRRIAGGLYAFFLLVGIAMPTSYIVQSPGPVLDVTGDIDGKDVVKVVGTETYESDTDFLMTTVTATGNADNGVPGVVAAGAVLTRDLQLVPVRALYPAEVSSDEVRERNVTLMNFSQNTAASVAFETAGMDVSMTLSIAGVPEDSPAFGILEDGDVIKEISSPALEFNSGESGGGSGGGTEGFVTVKTFMDLSGVLDATPAGTDITLKVDRDGQEKTVNVTTRAFEPDATGWVHPGSMLGVFVEVTDVVLPADVEYVIEGMGPQPAACLRLRFTTPSPRVHSVGMRSSPERVPSPGTATSIRSGASATRSTALASSVQPTSSRLRPIVQIPSAMSPTG